MDSPRAGTAADTGGFAEKHAIPGARNALILKCQCLCALLAIRMLSMGFFPAPPRLGAVALVALADLAATLSLVYPARPVTRRTVVLVIVTDLLALTAVVYLTGGPDQVSVPILYAAIIGLAGLLLGSRQAMVTGAAAGVLYLAVCLAVVAGVLPRTVDHGRHPVDQVVGASTIAVFFFAVAGLIAFITRQARQIFLLATATREQAVHDLAQSIQKPLERVLQLAERALRTGTAGPDLRTLKPEIGQAVGAIETLLGISLIEKPGTPRPTARVALAPAVTAACTDVGASGQVDVVDRSGRAGRILCDPERLRHVLRGVLRIAVRHAGERRISAQIGASGKETHVILSWPADAPLARHAHVAGQRIAAFADAQFDSDFPDGRAVAVLRLPRGRRPETPPYAAPIPGVEQITVPVVSSVYRAKTAALLVALLAAVAIRMTLIRELPLLPLVAAAALSAAPSWAIARLGNRTPPWLWALSLTIDVLAATAGIHLGGGIEQVAGPQLYVLLVGVAGLLVSPRASWFVAGGSSAAYGALVWAEYAGRLPAVATARSLPGYQFLTALTVAACLAVVAAVVQYAARVMREYYAGIDAARREAVAALAHDVRNPITVIRAYTELGEDFSAGEPARAFAVIARAARSALDLVLNVLAVERVQDLGQAPERHPVYLESLVRSVVADYAPLAELRDISLATGDCERGLRVLGDHSLLARAVGNLLSNALRYCRPGDRVTVSVTAAAGEARIVVADTGPGIDPERLSSLGRPYERGNVTRSGFGLGLYIVDRVARAHGGRLDFVTEQGRGTQFIIRLPTAGTEA